MKFLKKSKRWMKAHWQNKSFRMHRPEEQTDPERDPAGTGVYSGVGIDRGMCNVSVVCAVHDHIRTSRKYPGRRYVPDLLFYYKGRCRHG